MLISIQQATAYKNINRTTLYRQIRAGKLSVRKDPSDRRIRLVDTQELDKMLLGRLEQYVRCPKCDHPFKYKEHMEINNV